MFESFVKKMFPEVWHNPKDGVKQSGRILDEYLELSEAIVINDRDKILEEGIDVAHCVFNTLYKFGYSDRQIYRAIINNIKKNTARGYYKK